MRLALTLGLLLSIFSTTSIADSKEEIDAFVEEALENFYEVTPAGKKLSQRAKGILVFPSVIKAGLVFGGEYGEGKLIVNGQTEGYYNVAAASFGLQAGVQEKSQILLFMTNDALERFTLSDGWDAGVDGSVAIASLGAGGEIDVKTAREPIIAFVFGNKGLMFNLNFEGTKITKINR